MNNLYTEEQLKQAAQGGYDNGVKDMKLKLRGLRAQVERSTSFLERPEVLLWIDKLLSNGNKGD